MIAPTRIGIDLDGVLNDLLAGWLCSFFLRAAFAHGQRRYRELHSRVPLYFEAALVERPVFAGNASDIKTEYAGFAYKQGYAGSTIKVWLSTAPYKENK